MKQLLTAIQAKRDQVAEMTLALEELRLEVRRFEKEYHGRLMQFYRELDGIDLSTKEYRLRLRLLQEGVPPESPELETRVEACFRPERERLAANEREADEEGKAGRSLPPEQMKQLRTFYLKLAKIYHPDKARNNDEVGKRKQMMTLINRAYEDGDFQTLERMSVEVAPEVESPEETIRERKQRLIQEINRLMHAMGELRLETHRLQSSRIYQLKQEVEKSRESGVDLLANLARDLQRKINASKRGLANLVERFHQLSEKLIRRKVSLL
ncbi:hypothetical protein HYR99_40435 [Candidatus Poribacteria bacterium]|nr:hypothetical protein [Candidatus Poribacteria bacterium]